MMNHLSHFPELPRPCSASTLPQLLQQRRPFGAERFLLPVKSVIPAGEAGDKMTVPCKDFTVFAELKLCCQQRRVVSRGFALLQQLHYLPPAHGTTGCKTVQRHTNNRHRMWLIVANKFGFALQGRTAWGAHGVDAEGSRRQAFRHFPSSGQATGGPLYIVYLLVACVCLSCASTAATSTAYLGRCQYSIRYYASFAQSCIAKSVHAIIS